MRTVTRWCVVVPGATVAALVGYYFTARAFAFAATALLGKTTAVDVSLGIALQYTHRYFAVLSVLLASVSIGIQAPSWRRAGFIVFALVAAPSLTYWAAMVRYAPYWATLVFLCTAAGFGVLLLVSRSAYCAKVWPGPPSGTAGKVRGSNR